MGLLDRITRFNRRLLTAHPTGVTPDAHLAWVQEQVKAYATIQPYAGPLSAADDNLTGETWEMRLAYRRMLKEPAVKAPLLKKVFAVASLDAQVIPEDKKSPAMVAAARWMDTAVKRMPGGWPQLLLNVMLPGLVDGFSLTEKVFDVVPADDPRYPRFWTVRACKSKDTKFVRFKLDQFKAVTAVQAMAAGQGGQPLDPGDFIHFTFLKIFESPFGMSDLRACYRGAMLIESAVKLRAILLENYSGPYLAAKYQAGDTATRDQVAAVLATARARGYIVLPDGADLQVMNLATSSPDQFQATIEDLRKEIALSLQGAYLDQVESKTPQGNSETHKTVAELFQWYLSVVVASTVTEQLGPDLVQPNFGAAGGRPTAVLGGIDPEDVIANGRRIEQAQKIGLPVSQEYAYEIMQVEPPRDAADVLKPTPAAGPDLGSLGLNGPPGGGGGGGDAAPGDGLDPNPGPAARAFADGSPRAGLVPKTGDPEHPGRWVRPGGDESGPTGRPAGAFGKLRSLGSAALDTKVGRLLQAAEHTLSIAAHKTRDVAVEAARRRGHTPEQAERLKRTLAVADFVGGYVTGAAVGTAVSPAAGKAAAFLPSVSALYLGYSTAVNPAATWKAALEVVRRSSLDPRGLLADLGAAWSGGAVVRHADGAGWVDDLAALLAADEQTADWRQAVFLAGLVASGDPAAAVELAGQSARPGPGPADEPTA